METSATLRPVLLKFVQAFLVQTAQTAVANAQARLEERLCRWLLMCHDRVDTDTLPLTHAFLATMLGVRRAGVTTALHLLEGRGLIRATRGCIEIVDREGLKKGASGTYGTPEREYQRLVGVSLRGS
jgi:CRP-like cAMP-binding protein